MKADDDILATEKIAEQASCNTDGEHRRINLPTAGIIAVCAVVVGLSIFAQQKPDGISFIDVPTKTETHEEASDNIGYFEPAPNFPTDESGPDVTAQTEPEIPIAVIAPQDETLSEIMTMSLPIADTPEPQAGNDEAAVLPTQTTAVNAPSSSITQTTTSENISSEAPAEQQASSETYVLNTNTKKFHYSDCSSVNRMSDKNKEYTSDREYAIAAGYTPCARCNP